jgi:tRNA (guanine-N7-)-methyltransferase
VAKKKLAHFAENLTFKHLFQYPHLGLIPDFQLKNKWHEDYFHNDNPIILELGCGKGEYTVNLALKYPGKNFIGMDIKGARLWKGCKMVEELGLKNVAFIRSRGEFIESFFTGNEVEEIWLTFPDPQPQSNRIRKRLTSPEFLERYKKILKPGGIIHLKTDNIKLYKYSLGIIRDYGHELIFTSDNIYSQEDHHEATAIRTYYEDIYRNEGIPIKYIEFTLCYES